MSANTLIYLKKIICSALYVVLVFNVVGATCYADNGSQADEVKNPTLRDELFKRVERDQEARQAAIAWEQKYSVDGVFDEGLLSDDEKAAHASLVSQITEIDTGNTEWLKEIVAEGGWPTYSEVGIDGGDAAWLLVQHADADSQFQRKCLELMTELPKEEISQPNLAYLTDRVLLAEGKSQIYGTQFVRREGKWIPLRLEDAENVDARRAEVGLPPLAEYAEMFQKVMRGEEID